MDKCEKIMDVNLRGSKVQIHYEVEGYGPGTMITFHGFGQTGNDMSPVAAHFAGTHTTYHMNIFFHGKSFWDNDLELLEPADWRAVLSSLLEQEDIQRFSLAAFSMGGKFALATIEAFAPLIDEVYLLAPDGIRTSPWYSLATYPQVFQDYFRSMIIRPNRFFWLINTAHRMKIVDRGLVKFASNEMDTVKKRRRVYYSWVVFRELVFDMKKIGALIRSNGIRLTVITGKFDKIIRTEHMKRLTRHVPDAKIIIAESGHNQLVKKGMEQLGQKNL